MLPRFDNELPLSDDKQGVRASGPLAVAGNEVEAYLWLRIAQGADPNEVDAARQRELVLTTRSGNPATKWRVTVRTSGGKKFKAGPAMAEAWLLLREEGDTFESQTYWKTKVTLKV
jgi:hypothetical protein